MEDRELLELAAKAIGKTYVDPMSWDDGAGWNPLEDDGDAFRLAMKLDMTLCLDGRGISAQAYFRTYKCLENLAASGPEGLEADKSEVVRRQIVRVAAMIGEICHHA